MRGSALDKGGVFNLLTQRENTYSPTKEHISRSRIVEGLVITVYGLMGGRSNSKSWHPYKEESCLKSRQDSLTIRSL